MSLRVWLPLCGNLNNNGLEDLTVSNNGATVDNNGKLGKCYAFSGSDQYLEFNKALGPYYNNDFSYAVWLKPMEAKRGIIISEYSATGSGNVTFELNASLKLRIYWNGSPDIYTTDSIPTGKWTHVAIVKTAEQIKFYVNGTLNYTHNQSGGFSVRTSTAKIRVGDDYRSGTTVDYKGSMNDLRIYDHALSVKEVKELAKGLVVHYPLNNNGMGVPNMVDNSLDFTGWTAATGWTKSISDDGSYMYSYSRTGATTNNWQRLIPTLQIDGNNYPNGVTVSLDFYTPDISAVNHKCIGSLQTYQENGTRIGWREPTWDLSSVKNGKWTRVSAFFAQNYLIVKNGTPTATYAYTMFSFQLVQNGDISIRKIKIEAGDKTTPYTLSTADVNDTTIYDTSGYNQHGTVLRVVYPNENSIRNQTSTLFTQNDKSAITLPDFAFENMDYGTLSFWINIHSFKYWSHFIFFANSFNWTGKEYDFIIIATKGNSGDTEYDSKEVCLDCCSYTNSYTMSRDTWYHVAITWDSVNYVIKRYINGVLHSTNDDSTNKRLDVYRTKHNRHYLGDYENHDNYRGQFDLSDFRIYATALSADDIKALYNTPISIAKNGTLFIQGEYVEVS